MNLSLDTSVINLGRDSDRIKTEDATRQTATVNHLLKGLYGPRSQRRELQILADEVGMGKTYVALATAFAVLSVLRDRRRRHELDDVANSYRCVLVITPSSNATLSEKWDREDDALLKRCAVDPERAKWFQSKHCETADELLDAIEEANDLRRRNAPVILVAQSNIFTKRLSDPAVRFVTACLFRWWGNGLQHKERYHVVRGLAETPRSWSFRDTAQWSGAGEYETPLWDWSRHERFLAASDQERESWEPALERRLFEHVSVTYEQMSAALDKFSRADGHPVLDQLRQACKDVPTRQPGDRRTVQYREYVNWFRRRKDELRDVFKRLWPLLLDKRFPLVIVDEAHHWRNNDAGEFRAIREFIAPFARRMLLLTATPFQLNPQETINVLNVIEHMAPAIGRERVAALVRMRDHLSRCMESSAKAGQAFSKEWGTLADQLARTDASFSEHARIHPLEDADPRTERIGELWSHLLKPDDGQSQRRLQDVPGPLRPFFMRALELHQANQSLRSAMRPLVVRHRRCNRHRRYWVGREYPPNSSSAQRPDFNRLHLAPGQPLDANDELIQYLLMKVVAALSRGRHRTALGTALTGCYTTMWQSREGRKAIEAAARGSHQGLMEVLKRLTGSESGGSTKDSDHPKLRRVVNSVLERWDKGEKSLIFCFRVPTAQALRDHLDNQIKQRLKSRRDALFTARGTVIVSDADRDKAMQQFRRSLTARDASGVPLFIDRVLIAWFQRIQRPVPVLTEADVNAVASLAARARVNGRRLFLKSDRPDRVFFSRAIEHVWARRLVNESARDALAPACDDPYTAHTAELLRQMADEAWVSDRYGQHAEMNAVELSPSEPTDHAARSSLSVHFDLDAEPDPVVLKQLTGDLLSRLHSAKASVFRTLTDGPNIFAPTGASFAGLSVRNQRVAAGIREALFQVTLHKSTWDWPARRNAVDALVRAMLRDDILLRMSVSVFSGEDETWSESLFEGLHQPFGAAQASETLAERIRSFLDELARMSDKERDIALQHALNPKAEAVALVKGGGETEYRSAVFAGFNTPLLPEILVCTAVGQEGIDLHRECRHVIHYDLGWNPATIEQRTGRADRIGSKTERERQNQCDRNPQIDERQLHGLDIALPYLAATYDERMFEALRTRAQVFEILTGGDPTADRDADSPWTSADDEGSELNQTFVPLPAQMLEDLKVDLSIRG